MSLPAKKTIEIDENVTHYVHKMLSHEMILKYDESKCVTCGFCARVCPVTISIYDEPLKKTAIGTPEQMGIDSNKKIVVDVLKCVHCGACSWICPGYTLELLINGENKILLVENGSLAEFDEEVRTLENGHKVRKVVHGSIKFNSSEKDAKVIDAFTKECAVDAMSLEGNDISVDIDKCILCF